MEKSGLSLIIFLSGVAHLILCVGSIVVPKMLKWSEHLHGLPPLIRQMFWTYAGYILVINAWFGVVSVFGSAALLDSSFLASALTAFISVYWFARVLIQFFYFDRSNAPKGIFFTLGEIALVVLFISFTFVYAVAFFKNIGWI